MLSLNHKSNIINVVLIIVIAALMHAISPRYNNQLTGIILPIAKPLSAVPATNVQILNNFPAVYQPLGQVNLEQHAPELTQDEHTQTLLDAARAKAGSIGANAIVITTYGQSVDEAAALTIYELQGVAIKTPTTMVTE